MNDNEALRTRTAHKWRWYVALALALVIGGGWIIHMSQDSSSATPVPSLSALPENQASQPAISPKASASPTPIPTSAPVISIPPSIIQQLYIPAPKSDQTINVPVLAMPNNCQSVIEPPTSGPHVGDVFQCMDFAMPGTDSTTNAVVAGHSSYDLTTVFNKLYPQGDSLVGRTVFVRTQASGSRWLAYHVQHVYLPTKDQLPYMEELWRPTPGRLILVTCMQEGGGVSTKNFVVVAQFVGIQQP